MTPVRPAPTDRAALDRLARRRWARVGWAYATLLAFGTLVLGLFYVAFAASLKNDPLEWPFDFGPPQLGPGNWVTAARLGAEGGGDPLLGGLTRGSSLEFRVVYFVPQGLEFTPPVVSVPARSASARLVSPPPRPLAADYTVVELTETDREAAELAGRVGEAVTYTLTLRYGGEGPRVQEVPLDLSLDRDAWQGGAAVLRATLPPDRIERRGRVASWDNLSPGFLGYTFKNYVRVFRNTTDREGESLFWRWTVNSAVYAGVRVLAAIVFASAAGYALARLHFPGRAALFLLVLFSQMVPAQVTFISN